MSFYTVYFDVETGGVQPNHPTISLAATAVDERGEGIGCFYEKIAFKVADCDPEALAINGYTKEAWEKAEQPSVIAEQFRVWLKPYCSIPMKSKRPPFRDYTIAQLAGYNALTFDEPRLRALFGASFCPWSYLVRDVLQRVLFYFDERPNVTKPENFKLATVCEYFDIPITAHDALGDARATSALAMRLREEVW